MRRMYSENQLIKLIEEHAGEGQVLSVNGKTGAVVLKASDIKVNNTQSIQANLERIDGLVEDNIDDIAAIEEDVAVLEEDVGGLDTRVEGAESDIASLEVAVDGKLDLPSAAHPADCLLGIDPENDPLTITVGSGLSLSNGQLSATGGSGTSYYTHSIEINDPNTMSVLDFRYVSSSSSSKASISAIVLDMSNNAVGIATHGEGQWGDNGRVLGTVYNQVNRLRFQRWTSNGIEEAYFTSSDTYSVSDTVHAL